MFDVDKLILRQVHKLCLIFINSVTFFHSTDLEVNFKGVMLKFLPVALAICGLCWTFGTVGANDYDDGNGENFEFGKFDSVYVINWMCTGRRWETVCGGLNAASG
jgi:hypothetical protein